MSPTPDLHCSSSFLDELDARQDDLLSQLEQLNKRIETLLGRFSAPSELPTSVNWPAEGVLHLADSVSER